jgi:hypothetical protein
MRCQNETVHGSEDSQDESRAKPDAGVVSGPVAPRATVRALQDPVVVVLVLAGIFDGLAGNPVHAILLVGVGLILARSSMEDAARPVAPPPSGADGDTAGPVVDAAHAVQNRVSPGRTLIGVAIAALYAVIVGSFERYSWPATVAVLMPGLLGLLIAWRDPVPSSDEPAPISQRGRLAWSAVFVALGLWELTNLLLQPSLVTDSYTHPTLSVLMDPILALHTGRSIMLFLWTALGWYLVRR